MSCTRLYHNGPFFWLFCPLLAFGSLHGSCDAKCFFHAHIPSEHRQPACTTVSPLLCGSSEPLMRAIRQELKSHSMIVLLCCLCLTYAAHLTPPPRQDLDEARRVQILAKYLGKRGLFGVIPNLGKILGQDSDSIRSVHLRYFLNRSHPPHQKSRLR